MADRSRDPEALEREIERTRQELARTIDALADRVNPRNVAHRGAERVRAEAGQVARTVQSLVAPPGDDGEPGPVDRRVIYAAAGVAVAVTVLVVWRKRR
ncbi:DUF3618 domain-containing protein [Actinomadura flavalba]|uniref:DUF3618 domain-containing protein n=1 Tax=Actinomadura flavalba TaxID=1120938 RepID=UPI000526BBD1|nr:DUF3618 domain-containing protein [Actinomadura flavalba]